MIVAFDLTDNPTIAFNDCLEAGLWSKTISLDIERALDSGLDIYGYTYKEVENLDAYPGITIWEEQEFGKQGIEIIHALKLMTAMNEDKCSFDIKSGTMLTAEEIYSKYWEGLDGRKIFEALVMSVDRRIKFLDHLDAEKKELQQLVITQKELNSRGEPCVYVPIEDAHSVIEEIREASGLEGKVAIDVWEGEGYIGKHDGVCYFAVKELIQEFSFEQWRNGLSKST